VLSTEGAIPLEVPAGGLVILHGDLVHFSKDNRSGVSRHAFTLHSIETAYNVAYPAENWYVYSSLSMSFVTWDLPTLTLK
jgi:phytanoyl-CoA hydroxylase